MTTTTVKTLSKNDLAILGTLFDPEAPLSSDTYASTTSTASVTSRTNTDKTTPAHIILAEKAILRPLNTPNPSSNQLKIAISKLSHLIIETSTYASLYANRAQATRLLPNSLFDPILLHSILSDLHCAISIATTPESHPQAPDSQRDHDRILSTAHIHRAYILLSASNTTPLFTTLTSLDLPHLGLPSDITRTKLEELASRDFSIAGKHGDEEARRMAVKTNPYAKLCGGIVREALREEIRGFYEGREGVKMGV